MQNRVNELIDEFFETGLPRDIKTLRIYVENRLEEETGQRYDLPIDTFTGIAGIHLLDISVPRRCQRCDEQTPHLQVDDDLNRLKCERCGTERDAAGF